MSKQLRQPFIKECVSCGNTFECAYSCRTTCSNKCRVAHRRGENRMPKQCIHCGTTFIASRSDQTQCVSLRNGGCPAKPEPAYAKKCAVCNMSFIAKSPKKLSCSPECDNRRKWPLKPNATKQCANCDTQFEVSGVQKKKYCSTKCKKTVERKSEAYKLDQAKRGGRIMSKKCVQCGAYGVRPDSSYCNRDCSRKARYKYLGYSESTEILLLVPAKKSKQLPFKNGEVSSRYFAHGSCKECGIAFTAVTRGKSRLPLYCSDNCSRRSHSRNAKHIRRERMKRNGKSAVYRSQIFKRDNYTCKLCNEPLDMDAQPNDNRAPSLDHILPLAKGGSHTMSNLQAAHRLCNSIKCDRLELAIS